MGGVEWIHLAQDGDRWRAVVNAVMNLRVLAPRSYSQKLSPLQLFYCKNQYELSQKSAENILTIRHFLSNERTSSFTITPSNHFSILSNPCTRENIVK
jgi:hypothetical protein